MSNQVQYVLYFGSVATWLRSNLTILIGDAKEEEIHLSDCLELVRQEFTSWVYHQQPDFDNPIAQEWEQYNLPQNVYQSLYNGLLEHFQLLIINTVGVIDPQEYINFNFTGPDSGIISQTTNKAYYNDRIRESTQVFTAEEHAQRYV